MSIKSESPHSTTHAQAVRDGHSPSATTRYSVSLDATNRSHGTLPTTFRLVKGAAPLTGAPPLPQVAILPSGVATIVGSSPTMTVDVSKLGPDMNTPHFAVRAALPIPPDSELIGSSTLAGLDPATMWHSHSPGLEVMRNGDVVAVWFSSSAGHAGEPGKESSINSRMVQARLRHGSDL